MGKPTGFLDYEREDLNYYDFTLNEENITRFNK